MEQAGPTGIRTGRDRLRRMMHIHNVGIRTTLPVSHHLPLEPLTLIRLPRMFRRPVLPLVNFSLCRLLARMQIGSLMVPLVKPASPPLRRTRIRLHSSLSHLLMAPNLRSRSTSGPARTRRTCPSQHALRVFGISSMPDHPGNRTFLPHPLNSLRLRLYLLLLARAKPTWMSIHPLLIGIYIDLKSISIRSLSRNDSTASISIRSLPISALLSKNGWIRIKRNLCLRF